MLSRLGMGGVLDRPDRPAVGWAEEARRARRFARARVGTLSFSTSRPNHLDLDAIAYLEEWLAAFPGGLLLVTHDRHVLDRVTKRCSRIDRGATYLHVPHERTGGIRVRGIPRGSHRTRSAEAATAEQTARTSRCASLRGCGGALRRARRSEGAHRQPPTRFLARGPAASAREGELGLSLGSSRLGSKGVELHGVGFSWPKARDGDDAGSLLVLRPFDHMLEPGDRLGIVGPNGAGKSTLLDLIAGRLQPTQGHVETGRTVNIGYYDQLGRDLDLDQSVRDAVAGGKGEPTLDDVKLSASSGSTATRSSRRSARCRAASAGACSSLLTLTSSPTAVARRARRTISTSTRCARSKSSSTIGPASSWSSATTASSSTAPSTR